jgi:hypothetical protein
MLQATPVPILQETACPEPAPNQNCSEAIDLLENVPVEGSLNNAELFYDYLNCPFFDWGSPTLWYSVEGSGACVTISVQSDIAETYLAVLEGEDCFDSLCLQESPSWDEGFDKNISFFGEQGSTYYVLVSAPFYYGDFGSFSIQAEVRRSAQTVESVASPVLNSMPLPCERTAFFILPCSP